MKLSRSRAALAVIGLGLLISSFALVLPGVRSKRAAAARTDRAGVDRLPGVILWAWERPADLHFIDPQRVGVAFLARTLFLRGDDVVERPRFQPLDVPERTTMIAVARIESDRGNRARLSAGQQEKLATAIAELAAFPNVSAIQIDFDATRSERTFYRDLIVDVRAHLPARVGLSITALASWCADDDWLSDLPIDEAVPMLFRMGPDRKQVLNRLSDDEPFPVAQCRHSYGVSTDEPLRSSPGAKRLYVFNPRSWSEASVRSILELRK